MIEAMVGRRMAEVPRPPPVQAEHPERPVIRWQGAASGDEFSDVSHRGPPRRGRRDLRQARLRRVPRSGETAFGLRPIDAGTLEVDGKPVDARRPGRRDRQGRRLPAGGPQGRWRVHGPPGRGERGGRERGLSMAVLGQLIDVRPGGPGVPALARAALDPLAERSRAS